MKIINYLETRPSSRYDEFCPKQDGNKNTKFADLIIDGRSLHQMLRKHDMVPSLGWGSQEHQRNMIDYFLLKKQHDYLYFRYPILVCPWCGDEECGFISVYIQREDDIIIWQDFKLEPSTKIINIGPFYFKWDNYERAINDTFGTAGIQ
ncbi:oxidoreductase [Paenibacillus sp. SYP-B3998]|uniref:Oxidoreductase n=1 Tax=Paenibacillus sp. SYP-B3998 TaxID=2678564 RepID=A0A6G3ZXJ7_9BACL|nr:oxidoreductase [Paenibacillus sp. SYP-B3998]NEW06862.1 oxidoreductase [Paenibacillus sp. SYP-B3998]